MSELDEIRARVEFARLGGRAHTRFLNGAREDVEALLAEVDRLQDLLDDSDREIDNLLAVLDEARS